MKLQEVLSTENIEKSATDFLMDHCLLLQDVKAFAQEMTLFNESKESIPLETVTAMIQILNVRPPEDLLRIFS